jgi:uncharacterized protein
MSTLTSFIARVADRAVKTLEKISMKDGAQFGQWAGGIINAMTGMGTSRDPTTGAYWGAVANLTREQCDVAYRGSWMMRQGVDIRATDMSRAWIEHKTSDADFIEKMKLAERKWNPQKKYEAACRWKFLFGGSLTLMGVDRGLNPMELMEPFDYTTTKKGQLRYLHVVDRWRVSPGPATLDIQDPNFDMPEYYSVIAGQSWTGRIHHTRVCRFDGDPLGYQQWVANNRWNESVLQAVQKPVQACTMSAQALVTLLQSSSRDVIKTPYFHDKASTAEGQASMQARVAAMASYGSYLNATILHTEEEFEVKQRALTELANIYREQKGDVAGAFNVPYSQMFGTSSNGLNATGIQENEMYARKVNGDQESTRPELTKLLTIIALSEVGRIPTDWEYDYKPIWTESDTAIAARELQQAQRDGVYLQAGMPLSVVLKNLQSEGVYAGLDDETIELAEEMEKAAPTEPPEDGADPVGGGPNEGGDTGEETDDLPDDTDNNSDDVKEVLKDALLFAKTRDEKRRVLRAYRTFLRDYANTPRHASKGTFSKDKGEGLTDAEKARMNAQCAADHPLAKLAKTAHEQGYHETARLILGTIPESENDDEQNNG